MFLFVVIVTMEPRQGNHFFGFSSWNFNKWHFKAKAVVIKIIATEIVLCLPGVATTEKNNLFIIMLPKGKRHSNYFCCLWNCNSCQCKLKLRLHLHEQNVDCLIWAITKVLCLPWFLGQYNNKKKCSYYWHVCQISQHCCCSWHF